MTSPRISVVMTTYNGARWLSAQIESIKAQTVVPSELIVCDDGSQDGTTDLIRGLTSEAAFATHLLPNRGPAMGTVRNLERGLERCSGELIVLSDQDDVWSPNRLAVTRSRLTHDADLLFSDGWLIDEAGERLDGTLWRRAGFHPRLQATWRSDPLLALVKRNVVTGATVGFRRSLLDMFLPIVTPYWHDAWFGTLAAATGHRVVAAPEHLVSYRLHGANVAGLPSTKVTERVERLAKGAFVDAQTYQEHFSALAVRAADFGAHRDAIELLQGASAYWTDHAVRRPAGREAARVARRWAGGDYRRFSSGWRGALLDLLVLVVGRGGR